MSLRGGRLAEKPRRYDLISVDALGPFRRQGGHLPFHLIGTLYENTSLDHDHSGLRRLAASVRAVFADAKPTTAMRDRPAHHRDVIETGNTAGALKTEADKIFRRSSSRAHLPGRAERALKRAAPGRRALPCPPWILPILAPEGPELDAKWVSELGVI